jgi:hypothetical protein
MFAIIKAESDTKRDGVCIIDGKPISKGEKVVLLGNKVKGQKITDWEVAHVAPKCANKVEKWIAKQSETKGGNSDSNNGSKGYGELDSIDEAFRLVATGNQRRDNAIEQLREFHKASARGISRLNKEIAYLNEQVAKLLDAVRLPESSPSNPPRPPADADNKPVNCLGISKGTGEACKQTQNRLQPNGYCGQHQGQSGDSERAELDKHADKERALIDRPAVSPDTLELLS